ncbi:MAG TPA: DUF6786 family protein [Polyangiaceae bacterium]
MRRPRGNRIVWALAISGATIAGCRSDKKPSDDKVALSALDSGTPVESPKPTAPFVTFADDVAFLSKFGTLKLFESPNGGRVAVSSKYQGRVMTSAVEPNGRSLGFINRKFIEEGKTGTPFDNYGGEDRFWLGPEGGQYGLYFPAGKPFVFASWQTPHDMQEGEWETKNETPASVTFARKIAVSNYAGTEFKIDVERKVSLIAADEASEQLGLPVPAALKWVAFATSNVITNAGPRAWTEPKGLVSVWILGMFAPVPGTKVIAPFETATKGGAGEIVNDRYFGKVPADRLTVRENDGFLVFKCDGQYRSKIGLGPSRAKPALGSYSDESKLLTIVLYTKPKGATRYVNSMWETQKEPYGGDVVNSYNDGPTEPGKPSLGGFYEIESSSPAAALAPGATLTHVHQTFHFTGAREALETIARKVLGVNLAQVSAM